MSQIPRSTARFADTSQRMDRVWYLWLQSRASIANVAVMPRASLPVVDRSGHATVDWYRWFERLGTPPKQSVPLTDGFNVSRQWHVWLSAL